MNKRFGYRLKRKEIKQNPLAHPLNELVKVFIPIANPRARALWVFPGGLYSPISKELDTVDQVTGPKIYLFEATAHQRCGHLTNYYVTQLLLFR